MSDSDLDIRTPLLETTDTQQFSGLAACMATNDLPLSVNGHDEESQKDGGFRSAEASLDSRTQSRGDQSRHTQQSNTSRAPVSNDEEEEEEDVLKYGAKHVIMLFVPVTICMLIVVVTMNIMSSYVHTATDKLIYVAYSDSDAENTAMLTWQTLVNALIILAAVVVMTIIVVLLYKFRCYKILHGWLVVASAMLLFLFSFVYLFNFMATFDLPLDMITCFLIIWNFGVIGMICIHWKGPLILQQAYLIISSALTALIFIKFLPPWTGWVVLGIIALWDLFAVLCPFGPLNLLVQTAQERNEMLLPALIYSSTVMFSVVMARRDGDKNTTGASANKETGVNDDLNNVDLDTPDQPTSGTRHNEASSAAQEVPEVGFVTRSTTSTENQRRRSTEGYRPWQQDDDDEERGVKLGLGDFIFYSLLVGKASSDSAILDWNTTIACTLAILIGLCFTLLLLAIFRKALPALPISIAFGLLFYFGSNYLLRPFMDLLTSEQVFV